MPNVGRLKKALARLRKIALGYPHTTEDFPWGHSAFKVKGKAFVFSNLDEEGGSLSLSVKLPVSGKTALTLPFASPTQYGLAKSGWVTSRFGVGDDVPIDLIEEWVDESFRAIAPKRVVAELESRDESTTGRPKRKKTADRDPARLPDGRRPGQRKPRA
jgi:predicted DNA-binding protein (MmcQ/YjbR family)